MNQKAYQEGRNLRFAAIRKGKEKKISNLAYQIKEAGKRDAKELCDVYLRACLDLEVSGKSSDIVEEILQGDAQEIGQSLALGLMSE